MQLDISDIRLDGGTQTRAKIDPSTVANFISNIRRGILLCPVLVFDDGAGNIWLADGFHRVAAHRELGHHAIDVDIRRGGRAEAFLAGLAANRQYGQPFKHVDKLWSAGQMVSLPFFSRWTSRKIGKLCGVDRRTVDARRPAKKDPDVSYYERNGKTIKVNVAKIREVTRKRNLEKPRSSLGSRIMNPTARALLHGNSIMRKIKEVNALSMLSPIVQVRVAELLAMETETTVKGAVNGLKSGKYALTPLEAANAAVTHLGNISDIQMHIRFCESLIDKLRPRLKSV